MSEKINAADYIKYPVRSEDYDAGYIWDAEMFMVAQVRGWDALERKYGGQFAAKIQDALAVFIRDAINEKLEREKK